MIALPPDIPAFQGNRAVEVYKCTQKASKHYNVDPFVLQTLLKLEGGRIGTIRRNKSNGTFDYGVMQVNTSSIEEVYRLQKIKINKDMLANDPCYNIHIGTWVLAMKIKNANGDIWKGVGNYHSKTRVHHVRYLRDAVKVYKEIYQHWSDQYKNAQKSL